jgi:hypothetical protein
MGTFSLFWKCNLDDYKIERRTNKCLQLLTIYLHDDDEIMQPGDSSMNLFHRLVPRPVYLTDY